MSEAAVTPELVGQWWSWVAGLPIARNPVTDPDGSRAGLDQPDGPVWLVAGTMSGEVHREWTMPAGRRLFLPVLCVVTVPWLFLGRSPDLGVTAASCSLNGRTQEMTPMLVRKLPVTAVAGNPFIDVEEREEKRVSTSGLWVLTEPLPPGEHDLEFAGSAGDEFELRVTCRIEAR